MILFADTSALIKLYVDEIGSLEMADRTRSMRIAASVLAYAEVYAAFARRLREDLITATEHDHLAETFEKDWKRWIVVPLRPSIGSVPRLVRLYPLRGADAVHLASALSMAREGLDVTLAVADRRLVDAAIQEGLGTFNPEAGKA